MHQQKKQLYKFVGCEFDAYENKNTALVRENGYC